MDKKIFYSERIPIIEISDYVKRIKKYCFIETEADFILMISRIYISRLPIVINKNNHHNILMTSILLAAKYEMDDHYSNKYYALIGGQVLSDLNKFEIEMLKLLDWNLSNV
jgi:hypothetical protein